MGTSVVTNYLPTSSLIFISHREHLDCYSSVLFACRSSQRREKLGLGELTWTISQKEDLQAVTNFTTRETNSLTSTLSHDPNHSLDVPLRRHSFHLPTNFLSDTSNTSLALLRDYHQKTAFIHHTYRYRYISLHQTWREQKLPSNMYHWRAMVIQDLLRISAVLDLLEKRNITWFLHARVSTTLIHWWIVLMACDRQ